MRKKYQSYRILPARTVSATHPRVGITTAHTGMGQRIQPTRPLPRISTQSTPEHPPDYGYIGYFIPRDQFSLVSEQWYEQLGNVSGRSGPSYDDVLHDMLRHQASMKGQTSCPATVRDGWNPAKRPWRERATLTTKYRSSNSTRPCRERATLTTKYRSSNSTRPCRERATLTTKYRSSNSTRPCRERATLTTKYRSSNSTRLWRERALSLPNTAVLILPDLVGRGPPHYQIPQF